MPMWSLIAAGCLSEAAAEQLRAELARVLATPAYGCGHSMLVIDPDTRDSGLHLPADDELAGATA
jgi:hypothetical protein